MSSRPAIETLSFDGKSWEAYAFRILRHKYDDYQRIDDAHGGDIGLEGFSRKAGTVFQCYCPEQTADVAKLYAAERNKITTDIKKFIENCDGLSAFLRPQEVRCWTLVVPKYNSKNLLAHMAKKRREVLDAKLSYVDPNDFEVVIRDLSDYDAEHQHVARFATRLPIELREVSPEEVTSFKSAEGGYVANIERKLNLAEVPAEDARELVDDLLRHWLQTSNLIADLHQNFPSVAEDLEERRAEQEKRVQFESRLQQYSSSDDFADVLRRLETNLREVPALNALAGTTLLDVVMGIGGDWLGRCPFELRKRKTS